MSFPGKVLFTIAGNPVLVHYAQGVTLGTLQAFYAHLEQILHANGKLEADYCVGYASQPWSGLPAAPTHAGHGATVSIADQITSFKEDSSRRSAMLRSGAVNVGCARPFFEDFRRCRALTHAPPGATTFGAPGDFTVVWDPLAFTALFRHFCYGLGACLELPRGAYFAGSSCLAAITLPAHTGAGHAVARLARIEERTREKLLECCKRAVLERRFFKSKPAIARLVMAFAADDWSLQAFNAEVGRTLEGGEGSDDSESDSDLEVSSHFDADGYGAYARSDIDIVVCADTLDEAASIVERTLQHVTRCFKDYVVFETPNSLMVVADFPERHVQIVTVITRSLDEYLLFVDLCATGMAFDGRTLYTSPRANYALNTGVNIVPQEMLLNRSDTPRRLRKYSERGMQSLVPGPLSPQSALLLDRASQLQMHARPRFLDLAFFEGAEDALENICSAAAKTRAYTETCLPRGWGITPQVVVDVLGRLQLQAIAAGRKTVVKEYDPEGAPALVFKHMKTPENWTTWGMCD
jgi:hypothetical protein